MNDYDHEYQTCTRKVRYRTQKDAWSHLAHKAGRRRHLGRWARDMMPYHCGYCGGYHNGHPGELGEDHVPMRVRRREWAELRQRLHSDRKKRSIR